jgi:hypothetical protein
VADGDAVQDVHALLHRMDGIAVEVGGALLELGEVFNRAQAAFGAMDLLVEHPSQARGIEAQAPLLVTSEP